MSIALGSFVAINGAMLASRMIHTKIDKQSAMSQKILSEGIYHVTTKNTANIIMGDYTELLSTDGKTADKIEKDKKTLQKIEKTNEKYGKKLGDKYLKPSGVLSSMGSKKCFFFAGIPQYKDLASNCAREAANYEFTAIKLLPNEEELSKYRQRSLNDDSITYKGICNLPEDRASVVELVLDLDKDGNIITREKTQEEIEKGYTPTEELQSKMKMANTLTVLGKAYFNEYKTVGNKLKDKLLGFKNKIFGSKNKQLEHSKEETVNEGLTKKNGKDNSLKEYLEVNNLEEIAKDEMLRENKKRSIEVTDKTMQI